MCRLSIFRFITFVLFADIFQSVYHWDLPVLPPNPPPPTLGNSTTDKLVPRHLWMAVRDLDDGLNYQIPGLFERNSNWETHVCTNKMKDDFMNTVFADTSLLWAYNLISPVCGAAKADLWRYAVLWTYGGAYIDDDSDIGSPLDHVIDPTDSLIVAFEKNGFNGNRCYVPRFHLSDFSAFREGTKEIFHGRVLLNWAIISAPRHSILAEVMKNAVQIIKAEYFQEPLLRSLNAAYRWEVIMCATGPSLLTATARDVVMKNLPNVTMKLANVDFKDFGGRFKAVNMPVKKNPKHYMNVMHRNKNVRLLMDYLPEPGISEVHLQEWQGHLIMGQNGKEIFYVDKGKKRGIPNYDTFMAMNLSMADVFVISDHRLTLVAQGDSMPPLDYPG